MLPAPRPPTALRLAVILLLCSTTQRAGAEEPAPERLPPPTTWTLNEIEQIAIEANPTLLQAQFAIAAARGQAFQAGRRPNPSVGYQASEVGNEGRGGQHAFIISQQLLQHDKLAWRINAANAEVLRLEQTWAMQEQRVLNDVRVAFYETLYAQTQVELAEKLVALGQRSVEIAKARYLGLETGRADYLQAQVALSETKLRLADAQNRLAGVWRRLMAVAALPDLQRRKLDGDLTAGLRELQWDDALDRILATSPEVAAAAAAVEKAHAAVHREIANARSSPTVQTGVGYDESTGDSFALAQFMIPLRIHDRKTGAIRAARSELSVAEHELQRVELKLRHRLSMSFERYQTARRRFEVHDEEIVPTSHESFELVRHGYEAEEYNYLALLNAQRTYVQASLDRLDALRELRSVTLLIDGMLLTGALQTQSP